MSPPKEEDTKSGSPSKKVKTKVDGSDMLKSETSKEENLAFSRSS